MNAPRPPGPAEISWRVSAHATASSGEVFDPSPASTCLDSGEAVVGFAPSSASGRPMTGYRYVFTVSFPTSDPIRVHHHSLPRLHRRMTLPAEQGLGSPGLPRSGFASPGNYELPAGHQDMMLHPAFVAFQTGGPGWLCGPLSQDTAKAGYTWRLLDPNTLEVSVAFLFLGLPDGISPREETAPEHIYVQTLPGTIPFGPRWFEAYHGALRGRVSPRHAARHKLFWGTWNEGIYRNINAEFILREARWLAANLPEVGWIQIDDGYEKDADIDPFPAANLGGHWQEETACCPRRFPRGMRAVADEIRALGLRPMIWFSPACSIHSPLFKAHPDYFIPDARLHFETNLAFPDYSLPEVRAIAGRALDRLFIDWGFEGVKLDFWSYGFEQPRLLLKNHTATNLEWMRWLEREIVRRLPPDGLMLSCLEPANGDPFRGAVWDQHRIGPDIDGVGAETLEEIAVWLAALVGLKQTQLHFSAPDADGLSLFRHKPLYDAHWRLATTLLVATGSVTEIAGRLSEQTADARMPVFRRAVAASRSGQKVSCPAYDWTENDGGAPRIWVRLDDDGRRVIGFTNWGPSVATLTVTARDADLPEDALVRDLFTGEEAMLPLTRTLPAGEGALWTHGFPGR